MKINAYGKLNLSLDILGKRPDGYHEVSMLMQSVSLCDVVSVEPNSAGLITVTCDNENVPDGKDNIVYKACEKMKDTFSLSEGFDVSIEKHIPIAGGMAGGSTDAAAALLAINEICGLNLSTDALMKIGVTLGADVPFCIYKKPALATGIGEVLTPAAGLPETVWILLVNPGVFLSTKKIYEIVDSTITYGTVNNDALISALKNCDVEKAKDNMVNVMQTASNGLCDEISRVIEGLKKMGALHAMMTGSGATCFGIFREKPDIEAAKKCFPDCFVELTKPLAL